MLWTSAKLQYEYTSKEDGFSANFPKKPKQETVPGGMNYSANSGGVGYRVSIKHGSTDLDNKGFDDKARNMLQRGVLQGKLDSLQEGNKREIIFTNTTGDYLGRPCAEVIYQMSGTFMIARYFIVGYNDYHIVVGHRKVDIAERQFELFTDSFKLID